MITLLMAEVTQNADKMTLLLGKITAIVEAMLIFVRSAKFIVLTVLEGLTNKKTRFAKFLGGVYKSLNFFSQKAKNEVERICADVKVKNDDKSV